MPTTMTEREAKARFSGVTCQIVRTVCIGSWMLSGFAACADGARSSEESACGFLLQHEIDRMLADLDASPWPTSFGIGFVDFAGKEWAPFDYVCPTCGTCTSYPRERGNPFRDEGYAAFLTNLHHTVAFLRAKRLNVSVDERILCSSCRTALNVPDRGEIVSIPKKWPPSMNFGYGYDAARTNFPFRVGDKVLISDECNMWGRRCYRVVKENASYWIAAKDVSPDGKITAEGTGSWVRLGPGPSCPSVGFINRWGEPERGVPIPETETNGWMRLTVATPDLYYACCVPTGYVGRIASSGAALCRHDLFKRLKWTINGREIEIAPNDGSLLRAFFSGLREIPGQQINASLKMRRNRSRLDELLSLKPPSPKKPDAETILNDLSTPGGWTNGEISVETDF